MGKQTLQFKRLEEKRRLALAKVKQNERQLLQKKQREFDNAMATAKQQFERVLESSFKENKLAKDDLPPYEKELRRQQEIEMEKRQREEEDFLNMQEMMKEFDMKDMRAKNNLLEAKNREKSKMMRVLSKIEDNRAISDENHQKKLVEIATNYVSKLQKIEAQCKVREAKIQESVNKKRKEFEMQVNRMKQVRSSNLKSKSEKLQLQKMKYFEKIEQVKEFKEEKLRQLHERIQELNEQRSSVLEQHELIKLDAVNPN